MHFYSAYGLCICSVLPLPELETTEEAPGVHVRFGEVSFPRPADGLEGYVRSTPEGVHLFWEDAGSFLVSGGKEIIVDAVSGAEERVLRLCILGPALGVLLHQRERLALHGSAVTIDGGAVAFLGEAGQGKSTMAAAFHARGRHLVADDVVAVQMDQTRPMVFPGFPQLKLSPEAAVFVGDDPRSLPRLEPNLEKRARRVRQGFSLAPLPLKRVYVLAEGQTLGIETLGPREALIELVRHTYAARLLREAPDRAHFLRCTDVVNNVSVRILRRPRSLSMLPELMRLVENDSLRE